MAKKSVEDTKAVQIAMGVARGHSLAAAARSAGVAESTARRWAAEPEFPKLVARLRRGIISQSVGMLSVLMTKAAVKLDALLDDADPEIRLKACRAVFADFLSLHAHSDLGERIDALEAPADDEPR